MSELNKLLDRSSDVETERAADTLRWEVIICMILIGVIAGLSSC